MLKSLVVQVGLVIYYIIDGGTPKMDLIGTHSGQQNTWLIDQYRSASVNCFWLSKMEMSRQNRD